MMSVKHGMNNMEVLYIKKNLCFVFACCLAWWLGSVGTPLSNWLIVSLWILNM